MKKKDLTLGQQLFSQLDLLQEKLLNGFCILQVWQLHHTQTHNKYIYTGTSGYHAE